MRLYEFDTRLTKKEVRYLKENAMAEFSQLAQQIIAQPLAQFNQAKSTFIQKITDWANRHKADPTAGGMAAKILSNVQAAADQLIQQFAAKVPAPQQPAQNSANTIMQAQDAKKLQTAQHAIGGGQFAANTGRPVMQPGARQTQ